MATATSNNIAESRDASTGSTKAGGAVTFILMSSLDVDSVRCAEIVDVWPVTVLMVSVLWPVSACLGIMRTGAGDDSFVGRSDSVDSSVVLDVPVFDVFMFVDLILSPHPILGIMVWFKPACYM